MSGSTIDEWVRGEEAEPAGEGAPAVVPAPAAVPTQETAVPVVAVPEEPNEETAVPEVSESAGPSGEGGEAPPASDANVPKWAQRRIDEVTRKRREAEEEAATLRQRIAEMEAKQKGQGQEDIFSDPPAAAVPPGYVPASEVERLAQQVAARQAFDNTCATIYQKGKDSFPDWDQRMETIRLAGGFPESLIEAAVEAGDPHVIIANLANNPGELGRLSALPPVKLGAAIAKMSGTLGRAAVAPKVSAAPLPPEGRARGTTAPTPNPETMTMDEFVRYMDAQDARRRSGG